MRRTTASVIALIVLLAMLSATVQAGPLGSSILTGAESEPSLEYAGSLYGSAEQGTIGPDLRATLQTLPPGEAITVIVTLRDRPNLHAVSGHDRKSRKNAVVKALQATAETSQRGLADHLRTRRGNGRVVEARPYWIFNGLVMTATAEVIDELSRRPEVKSITPNATISAPVPLATAASPEPNSAVIQAPALWQLGYRGQGIVVANMDTGVDLSHPDLIAQWRGGTNSWFDPNGEHPTTPTDVNGHGTLTMGIMVGRDAGGTAIGVAPDARWIAVKIFNDQGAATIATIHAGFQWLLDPDGNPNTADAPDVVSNSWAMGTPGCYLEFQPDVQALLAAGIVSVFSAGNYGPGEMSGASPANYPESLSVGATDNGDAIASFSSRGPSTCGGASTVFPQVMAPGVSVLSTGLWGSYHAASGTSFSAPHVAGALALLLSAHPDLSAAQQKASLLNSAIDLGPLGPDDTYGNGRIDVSAAYRWLTANLPASAPTATPTPLPPTSTPTPMPPTFTPTLTPTPLPATATPTPNAVRGLHIGDLDGSVTSSWNWWKATVTILVQDHNQNPLRGATVTGTWSNGYFAINSCTTDLTGRCKLTTGNIYTSKATSVTFTVNKATYPALTYRPTENHDPDGESNGTTIVIRKP